jgi:seryl-tRNA synthetase
MEFSVPYILNYNGFFGSGHLPKDKDNMFKIEGEEKYLIPTGEPVLVNLGRNKKWDDTKRFCTLSACFRKEAGSAGKDLKGLIRLHQFQKCEMVIFAQPNESYIALEEMLLNSCDILDDLNIPWRVLLLCSGDSPVTSAKTYDIEIPIGGKWREVASISNCTDYQSFNINCRNSNKEFLHILNGSALPLGRTLASLLEVHFNEETNSILIPNCLHKYLNFTKIQI